MPPRRLRFGPRSHAHYPIHAFPLPLGKFTTPRGKPLSMRQLTLAQPTDEREIIIEAVLGMIHQIWTDDQPVRLIGVGISGLGAPPRQMSLWDASVAPTPQNRARQ